MLNKNDPLIGAVQEVMKRNQFEREAAKLVNEKFGVTDRKAMPHERLGEWDAAYKSVLTEGLHPNQQKLDVHEPEKDKLTAQDFKMLRAKKKPVEEEMKTDPYAEQQAGSVSTVSQPKKEVTPADQSALKKKIQSVVKEAKVNPYAVGMAAVKKSTGDEPPMEKKNIMKAHKIAKKIIAKKKMNEGFNNRHGLSVTASAEKQAVADQLNERLVDTRQRTSRLAPIYTQGIKQTKARLAREPAEPAKSFTQRAAEIGRGVEAGARGFASGLTDVGQTGYGYKSGSDYVLDYITPGRGQNLAREFPTTNQVSKGFGDLAGFVAGPEAAVAKGVLKGAKYGSQLVKGLRATEKGAEVAADAAKAKKAATAVSPAARETPGLTAAGQQAAANLAQKQKRVSAVRRQVSGAEPIAPPKPRTTQSGVPAIVSKKGPGRSNVERVGPFNPIGPRAPVRPTAPNAAAGNAARMAARQRLAAAASAASKDKVLKGAAATGLGAAGLKVAQSQYSSTTPSSAAGVTDAKAQGAKVGTSTLTKPSGSTAQPYGMNIPRKLNPDSRIAKGNVTPGVSPQTMQRDAEQDKVGVKRQPSTAPAPATTTTTGAPPKTAAPQAQRPQPQANQPSATERRENRRMLDKGLVVGPEAKRAQQRSGTGVTIQQKAAPQVNRPVGTGRVK